ncbi:MAG TPA: hypothetical protein VMJ90_10770 [Anaerolineales bacterium]|nr:hypothetical protein [Anaerolineales bacterium]
MDFSRITGTLTNPPARLVIGAVAFIIAVETFFFLYPSPIEFPMDDAYIHFVYADNLASHGRLFFNDVSETGIGTTSPLWVFLLAGLKLLGIPLPLSAKLLGALMMITLSSALYLIFRPVWKSHYLLLAIFLIAISGNLLWFSLSGMDTILFLAFGTLSFLAYRYQKWTALGAAVGLTILARPEGIILAGAIALVDVWANRGVRRELIKAMAIGALISVPWFVYIYLRSGYILPTSAIGKQFSFDIALGFVASRYPVLANFVYLRNLTYPLAWLSYLVLFALGGKSFPPPFLLDDSAFGVGSYAPSVWAIPVWLLIVLPLIIATGRWLASAKRWQGWVQDADSRPLVMFGAWILLHNIAYMLFFPVIGTASRYGMMNHLALWILLAMGASKFEARPVLARMLTGGLIVMACVNTLHWNRVYDSNIEHMQAVRIQAAYAYRDLIPEGENCAVFDIGAIRYFSARSILDISGLTNPEPFQWLNEHRADAYLVKNGATCLILPGQANVEDEGWIDFIQILGFDNSQYFTLQESYTFEMDPDRWMVGYIATGNQHRSVVIYSLEPVKSINSP